MKTLPVKYAIVRDVPNTYDQCVKPVAQKINVALAKAQHWKYCQTLQKLGLKLIRIKANPSEQKFIRAGDRWPDCCFVEDPAIVVGETAIINRLGITSRQGEEAAVAKALAKYKQIHWLKPPATLEGGDVLQINDRIYVGLSQRTNRAAITQVRAILRDKDYQIIPVKLRNILHLKSCCTYLGNNCVVVAPGHFDKRIFSEYRKVIVPAKEAYGANSLAINGHVLIPKGFEQSKKLIEKVGFETVEIEMSEFRKGGGSLTCLSIIF